jgi:hypothetical protein
MSLDRKRADRFSRIATAMLERLGPMACPLDDAAVGLGARNHDEANVHKRSDAKRAKAANRCRLATTPCQSDEAKMVEAYASLFIDRWRAPSWHTV